MRFSVLCETSRAAWLGTLIGGVVAAAPAATYYVSNNGLDTNPGTLAQPFATVARAVSRSASSDTLLLARGSVFREGGLTLSGARIVGTYGVATLPQPVLAGSTVITGWTPWDQNPQVLTATPSVNPIRQLYVNGQRMTLARFPNAGWLRTDDGSNDNQIVDAALASAPGAAVGFWNGAQVRWRKWTWIFETRPVTADNGAGTLTLGGSSSLAGLTGIGSGYYLDNTLQALDAPGEWFYDATANRLYLYPPSGTDPATLLVEAAWRPTGLTLNSATVEDLTVQHFTDTGLNINNPSTVQRCLVQHIGGTGIATSWNCGGTVVTSCTLRDILDTGISWIENPSGPGGSVIERSTLERIGAVPGLSQSGSWHSVGIVIIAARAATIRLNHIVETGYAGIILGSDGQTVTRNVFRRCMATLNDGGAIYTNCNASLLTENIILDTVGDVDSSHPWTPLGHGIWPEFLSKFHDSQLLNNTVYGSGGDGIWLPNNYNCTVSGNVLVSNHLAGFSLGGYESDYATPADFQQNHTLQNNLLAIGARPWRALPGQVQNLASWAATNDYLLGFATFSDRDLDFGTMSGTRFLTPNGQELVLRDGSTARSPAQWQSEESAWADPAPTAYQGNGYLFLNDTEATVNFPLPPGVTWQQLGGGAVGATVSIAPFRSVVLLATGGSVAGLSPYYLASGEAGPLSFAEWIASFGLTGSAALPTADPDGDGLANLAEYAAGLSPIAPGAIPPLRISAATGGGFALTWRQRTGLVGATPQLETSTDLVAWKSVDTTSATTVAVVGEPFVRAVTLSLAASTVPRAFFRLKVSQP